LYSIACVAWRSGQREGKVRGLGRGSFHLLSSPLSSTQAPAVPDRQVT
jgi:hypothetical protein